MTACIPDEPTYCFAPVAEADGEPPQIRLFVDGIIPSPSRPRSSRSARPTASPCATG